MSSTQIIPGCCLFKIGDVLCRLHNYMRTYFWKHLDHSGTVTSKQRCHNRTEVKVGRLARIKEWENRKRKLEGDEILASFAAWSVPFLSSDWVRRKTEMPPWHVRHPSMSCSPRGSIGSLRGWKSLKKMSAGASERANGKCWTHVVLMVGQRRRRCITRDAESLLF